VLITPIALTTPTIFKLNNKRTFGEWLFEGAPSFCCCHLFISVPLSLTKSVCTCKLLSTQLHSNPNSLDVKAEIIIPKPSPFGMMAASPFGPIQAFLVSEYCLKMHSSCPKIISGQTPSPFLTLTFPLNCVSWFILS